LYVITARDSKVSNHSVNLQRRVKPTIQGGNKQRNSNLRTRFQDHPHYFTNRRNFIRPNIKYNVFHKGAEIIIINQLVPENQSVGESVCEQVIAGVIQY